MRKAAQSCFGEQSVQVIYNDVARVAVWICMHPCALPGCELRFVMVTPLALYWLPGDQTRTISNAEVVLSIHGGCLDVPFVCELRCIVQTHRIQLTAFACHPPLWDVVSRGCAPGANG
jgi:hypothetical protein